MAVAAPNIYEYRGVEGLVYAEVTCDDNSSETGHGYVTGTVKPLAGIAELGKTNDGTTESHWYDNIPAVNVDSQGKDTVTIQASAIPLQVLAEITGQEYDSTTGMLIEGHRQTKYFAIGYRTGTVGSADDKTIYVWRLKGTFAIPEDTHKTEDEGTDANGQELVYTGIYTTHKFEKTGKNELAVVIDTGLDLIKDKDTFFDTVQTPDTVTAKA